MTNSNSFICQLPTHTQESIKNDLILALTELNLSADEFEEALQDGLDSKLCDLEDTIDIDKYL